MSVERVPRSADENNESLNWGSSGITAFVNELDVPEWAELALDKVEWRKLLQRIAL